MRGGSPAGAGSCENKKSAFFRLVDLLNREEIRYAMVGNTDEYPDRIGSDVDIVTDRAGMEKFHHAVWNLEADGLRVVQRFRHEITAFYYILAFKTRDDGWDFVQPDICTDYFRRAVKLLDAGPMLARSRPKQCPDCPGGEFRVLSPADEFVYYFLKKIGKEKPLTESQFRHLREVFALDPEGCRGRMAPFGRAVRSAVSAFEAGDASRLSISIPEIKRDILSSGVLPHPVRFRDSLRKIDRVLKPTGIVVAFDGDGGETGKTVENLHRALAGAFRRHVDFDSRRNPGPRAVFAAKASSTLVSLRGKPGAGLRPFVDLFLPGGIAPTTAVETVLDFAAARAKRRYRPRGATFQPVTQ
ncbi:MAG: hypothetical protein IJ678_06255 [Kiritimatiellae bacterium]|nr:hypothetical protein [Kiritimatiellia bacterium]